MKHGKILIIKFNENEELIYQQTMKLIFSNFSHKLVYYRKMDMEFIIKPCTRTFIDKIDCSIYLTTKQFKPLHFFCLHNGQVFTKEKIYEYVWGDDGVSDGKNFTLFIRSYVLK